jgi:hypothetical protein
MAALTFEMAFKRLQNSHASYSEQYVLLNVNTFAGDVMADIVNAKRRIAIYNDTANQANQLNEQICSLGDELAIQKLRLDDLLDVAVFMRKHAPADRKDYMHSHGLRLEHNLKQLSLSIQHMQAKTESLKETVATLIPSVSNDLEILYMTPPNVCRCGPS